MKPIFEPEYWIATDLDLPTSEWTIPGGPYLIAIDPDRPGFVGLYSPNLGPEETAVNWVRRSELEAHAETGKVALWCPDCEMLGVRTMVSEAPDGSDVQVDTLCWCPYGEALEAEQVKRAEAERQANLLPDTPVAF